MAACPEQVVVALCCARGAPAQNPNLAAVWAPGMAPEGLLPLCPVPVHISCQLRFPWGVLWMGSALVSGVTCGLCPGHAGAGCPQECQLGSAVVPLSLLSFPDDRWRGVPPADAG